MSKRRPQPKPMKTGPEIPPEVHLARLMSLVNPSLQTLLGMMEQGRFMAALETAFLYGVGQAAVIARQDAKILKAMEKAITEMFGPAQVEVDASGKTDKELKEEIKKATTRRPPIWTPGGDV